MKSPNVSLTLLTKELKAAVLANIRFNKQVPLVATEVSLDHSICDILSLDPKRQRMTEVEIKVTKSDLLKDFKKFKHKIYTNPEKTISQKLPNYFYYCVTPELLPATLVAVENTSYGVILYRPQKKVDSRNFKNRVIIKKRAKLLHKDKLDIEYLSTLLNNRMSSEICNLYINQVI